MYDYSCHSSASERVNNLGWETLEQHRLLNQCTVFFKIINEHVSISLPSKVRKNPRPSRNKQHDVQFCHLPTRVNCFCFFCFCFCMVLTKNPYTGITVRGVLCDAVC